MTAPVLVAAVNSRFSKEASSFLCAAGIGLAIIAEILTISRAGVDAFSAASMLALTTLTTVPATKLLPKKLAICFLVLICVAGITAKSWKSLQGTVRNPPPWNEEELRQTPQLLGRGYYIREAEAHRSPNNRSASASTTGLIGPGDKYGPELGYRFVHYRGVDKEPSTIIPSGSNVDGERKPPLRIVLAALTAGELGLSRPLLLRVAMASLVSNGRKFPLAANSRSFAPHGRWNLFRFRWNLFAEPDGMGLPTIADLLRVSRPPWRACRSLFHEETRQAARRRRTGRSRSLPRGTGSKWKAPRHENGRVPRLAEIERRRMGRHGNGHRTPLLRLAASKA